jgi:choline dehydrogenase-like flavoprotein
MLIENLATFEAQSLFDADLVIIGGGPAGLAIAQEFFGTTARVLILESGLLDEVSIHAELSGVESVGEPSSEAQIRQRTAIHGGSTTWAQAMQPYGARCRALGGTTHAWVGKSAAFDAIDFEKRAWVPYSGWPLSYRTLSAYLDRAAHVLNLGPNCYDEEFWKLIGLNNPEPQLSKEDLQSFFWQFARSRLARFDIMRFGREFATFRADNVRVLLNATATEISLNAEGNSFIGVQISTIDGARSRVKAKLGVIAASGIENARLLLASNGVQSRGVGNDHDLVGRFLMDHASARVGHFETASTAPVAQYFGFYGLRRDRRTHMYMRGLAPTPELQERERLLNSAVYFMQERAADDPWDAIKRLLQRTSTDLMRDGAAILANAPLLAKGLGLKALASDATPGFVRDFWTAAPRNRIGTAPEKVQHRGWPHKLTSISIDAVSEQRPDPDSRITLADRTDRLGTPLPRVDWRINDDERSTILRIARLVRQGFARVGLPQPILQSWVDEERFRDSVIIDMAHTMGTTRMSDDPKSGVVDETCRIHGVRGLYVAGGSIFPTGGHANPTLMIIAFAIRLADTIKGQLATSS